MSAKAKGKKPDAISGTPNKVGRPRKLIANEATLKIIGGLGRLQATVRECAAFLGVALSTYEEFLKDPAVREAYDIGAANGTVSLRRIQFRLAERNAAMAIWLGKQHLGQKDKQEHALTGPDGEPLALPAPSSTTTVTIFALPDNERD